MLSALGILPCEIFKIGVSEIQFPMLAGLQLVNQEGLLKHLKMLTKMKYLNLAIIFIVLQFFILYLTPKQIPIGNRVRIRDDRWFTDSNFECPV